MIADKWLNFIPRAITPGLLIAVIWLGSKWRADIENRTFDSVYDKVNNKNHMNSSPSEVDNYKTWKELKAMKDADALNKADAIKSRATRDSIMVEKARMDSLTAVTIYLMKMTQEEILEKINE